MWWDPVDAEGRGAVCGGSGTGEGAEGPKGARRVRWVRKSRVRRVQRGAEDSLRDVTLLVWDVTS